MILRPVFGNRAAGGFMRPAIPTAKPAILHMLTAGTHQLEPGGPACFWQCYYQGSDADRRTSTATFDVDHVAHAQNQKQAKPVFFQFIHRVGGTLKIFKTRTRS